MSAPDSVPLDRDAQAWRPRGGATPGTVTGLWAGQGRADLTLDLVRRRREDLLREVLTG